MISKRLISIIVPLFCEESVIDEFHLRMSSVLARLGKLYLYELIYINDGSTDSTGAKLKAIAEKSPFVRVLHLSRNFGHQNAITAGFDYAIGDAVVVIDGDLQDPPEAIPRLIEKWEENYQVVYAIRKKRKGESWFKLITASLFYRILDKLSDTEIPADTGDFRLLDRVVVDALKQIREKSRYIRGLISWIGFNQIGVEYERDARYSGNSKYSLWIMFRFAIDGLTGFSDKPLRVGCHLGLLITLFSTLILGWVIIGKVFYPDRVVQGWTSLAALVLFIGGVQLFFIGIIGEYIGRIYRETKNRPLYFVGQTDGMDSARAKSLMEIN
jgi:polyisoprenyl-phosphate glycosyltransferase